MNESERSELERLKQRQARLGHDLESLAAQLQRLETALNREEAIASETPGLATHEIVQPSLPPRIDAPPLAVPPIISEVAAAAFTQETIKPTEVTQEAVAPADFETAEQTGVEPAPPPIPTPPPLTQASQPPPKTSFEMRLGTFWLVRIGIVMLLTGLVFFANYAYQHLIGRLGPAGKVSLLYLASGALLGAGAWWQRKSVKESLKNYAQVLFAGGLAAVYFTTYVAHHIPNLRVIQSPLLDGALLLAWAGFMAWIADRKKSEVLALFAVGLAYYTSIITQVGDFTLYSNLVLTLAAVFFLVRNRWAALSFASLVATYASYAFWRFFHGGEWHWATPDEGLWLGIYFLAAYWVLFTAAVFLSRHENLAGGRRASFLTFNNGAFFTLFLLTLLQVHHGGFWKFSLGYGSVLLALSAWARRVFADEPIVRNSYLTQGLLLFTVGLISKYLDTPRTLALVLGAESVVLLVLGTQRRSLILQTGAYLAAAMSVGWGIDGVEKFDRPGLYLGTALGVLMVFNAFWSGRKSSVAGPATLRPTPAYFTVLALVIWAFATWQNVTPDHRPLVFGVEALLLTLTLGQRRLPELAVLGQGYILLAQLAWFVGALDNRPIFSEKLAALQLALVIGLESVGQLVLGMRRQSPALRVGGYFSAMMAVGWGLAGLEKFGTPGLCTGATLSALMVLNAYWSGRATISAVGGSLRPLPGFYTVLALIICVLTTWFNTSEANFPLVLAIEAVLLTVSIYWLRVPEIPLFGQGCLVLALLAWQVHALSPGTTLPWWNPLLLIGVTLGLSHWWQRQRVLVCRSQVGGAWQFLYALGVVGLLYSWLHPKVDAGAWLALVSLLGVGVTAYGVGMRAWWLAACGQILVLIGGAEFVRQLMAGKPEWYWALTPLAVLGLLSCATINWFERRPDDGGAAREPLLKIASLYRWSAFLMSVWWVAEYIPERERAWVFLALGFAVFLLAGWLKNREALLFGAGFSLSGLVELWLPAHCDLLVYLPNAVALTALLAQQQIARRQPARYTLPEGVQTAVIIVGCLSVWLFVSRWVLQSASGFYLTASWSGLALGLFACGIVLRERVYRWVGLAILAAALGRVVLFDVWKLETLYRVLSFMALGVVLLVLGFIYNKYAEKIRQWL